MSLSIITIYHVYMKIRIIIGGHKVTIKKIRIMMSKVLSGMKDKATIKRGSH